MMRSLTSRSRRYHTRDPAQNGATDVTTQRQLAAVGAISLLGACTQYPPQAQNPPPPVASNPPAVAPGPNAVWYILSFDTNSFVISAEGQKVVNDVIAFLAAQPCLGCNNHRQARHVLVCACVIEPYGAAGMAIITEVARTSITEAVRATLAPQEGRSDIIR